MTYVIEFRKVLCCADPDFILKFITSIRSVSGVNVSDYREIHVLKISWDWEKENKNIHWKKLWHSEFFVLIKRKDFKTMH